MMNAGLPIARLPGPTKLENQGRPKVGPEFYLNYQVGRDSSHVSATLPVGISGAKLSWYLNL